MLAENFLRWSRRPVVFVPSYQVPLSASRETESRRGVIYNPKLGSGKREVAFCSSFLAIQISSRVSWSPTFILLQVI
jgi:hypothetical protein